MGTKASIQNCDTNMDNHSDLLSMSRCLVVDRSYLGDVLMSSPIARVLSRHYERVDVLTLPHSRVVCEGNPYWTKIYTKIDLPGLRKNKYDLAINLHTSLKTNLQIMWRIGAKRTLGYDYKYRGFLHTINVPIAHRTLRQGNRTDEVCDLLFKGLNFFVSNRELILQLSDDALRIGRIFEGNIGLHVNCLHHHKERRWPGAYFAKLADMLIEKYNKNIIFTGSRDDHQYVLSVVRQMEYQDKTLVLTGLPFLFSAAIIKLLKVFVTLNTAMLHVAVALKVPTVAIIGRTPASVIVPDYVENIIAIEDPALVDYNPSSDRELASKMQNITPGQVLKEMEKII